MGERERGRSEEKGVNVCFSYHLFLVKALFPTLFNGIRTGQGILHSHALSSFLLSILRLLFIHAHCSRIAACAMKDQRQRVKKISLLG